MQRNGVADSVEKGNMKKHLVDTPKQWRGELRPWRLDWWEKTENVGENLTLQMNHGKWY